MRDEAELKQYARKLAAAMGYYVLEGVGAKGAADLVFLKNRIGFVVEFKHPNGKGVQSDDQKREQRRCEARGVPYYLCDNLTHFKEILLLEENYSG
jgi:hypothetical protein